MKNVNSNLVSSVKVYADNQYAAFTTLFRIPFKQGNSDNCIKAYWTDIIGSWAETCITALEMRMDACVSMLFRNRDNIVWANEHEICFKKNNGILHTFRHASFNAMESTIKALKKGDWQYLKEFPAGVAQLSKALYWIPEDMRKDHGSFGFGQLISCLEELEMGARLHFND